MHRFLKSQAINDKEGKHLLTVEYFKPDIQLSFTQIEVGEKTRTALSKLTTDQQKIALKGMKQFYLDTTKYLIDHLPIDNKLLRTVPTIVIAHTFCASPDTRISYRQCLLIQVYLRDLKLSGESRS